MEVVLFQKNHSASDSVISYLSSFSRLLNFVVIVPTLAPVSTSANALLTGYKQRFDNQSRSCNQGCSQYNSACLYIRYRPIYPLYCDFLWITLVQERTLKSGCTKINLYSLLFCIYFVQNVEKWQMAFCSSLSNLKYFSRLCICSNTDIRYRVKKILPFKQGFVKENM